MPLDGIGQFGQKVYKLTLTTLFNRVRTLNGMRLIVAVTVSISVFLLSLFMQCNHVKVKAISWQKRNCRECKQVKKSVFECVNCAVYCDEWMNNWMCALSEQKRTEKSQRELKER